MAQATLVDTQIKEGKRLIDRLHYEGVTVNGAAWIKESESGDWYLYLITPLVTEEGDRKPAYRQVNDVISEMEKEGFGMDPFAKKVIGPHDPVAKAIVANRSGSPTGPPNPFYGSRLGDLAIDEAYIYPRPPTHEEAGGIKVWECGGIDPKPGIGPAGLCRVLLMDLGSQTILERSDRTYRGVMHKPQPLSGGQIEVTWTEGGLVRIVGSAADHCWKWSQPRGTWVEGGCPPDEVAKVIITAMG